MLALPLTSSWVEPAPPQSSGETSNSSSETTTSLNEVHVTTPGEQGSASGPGQGTSVDQAQLPLMGPDDLQPAPHFDGKRPLP